MTNINTIPVLEMPTPEQIRSTRIATGLSYNDIMAIFGYSRSGWEKKENPKSGGTRLSVGEWNYLLLLAGQHPTHCLKNNQIEGEL